jgi:hypothetical protein
VRCQLVKSTDPVGFTAARKAGHGDLVRFCPLRLQLLPEDWKPKGSSE